MNSGALQPRIGVGAVSSPLEVGADRAAAASQELARFLASAGCDVVEVGALGSSEAAVAAGRRLAEAHVSSLALAVASWFEDYLVLDMLEESGVPILFWPLPGMETGALGGTQQTTAVLRVAGASCSSVFGSLADESCRQRALDFVSAAALRYRLRRARIGIVGHHLNGMTHTAPPEFLLKKALGPRVIWLDLPPLVARAGQVSEAEARQRWEALRARSGACDATDAGGLESARLYLALRGVVEENGLQALTIGCYPDLMGRVCLAASLLADAGIPMACEGDVHGAIGQYALQLLTGEPTHNTDWLDPVDEYSVVFTHCGSGSLSLAEHPEQVRLGTVRLMGQGVCALFTARPGPVTLLNLTPGLDHYKAAVLEAEAVPTTMVFPGNPVRVRFPVPVGALLDWIHREGLGHHWMIGYGHVGATLRHWADLAGPGVRLLSLDTPVAQGPSRPDKCWTSSSGATSPGRSRTRRRS